MFDPVSDEDDIRRARSRYNARKTTSPLIEWICSPEWTDVAALWVKSENMRGSVCAASKSGYAGDYAPIPCMSATGEIDVPCHPHCKVSHAQ